MASQNGIPQLRANFEFKLLNENDSSSVTPRLGELRIAERENLNTPNFFAVSSRGVIPHTSPDAISSHTMVGGIHIALEDCEWCVTVI
jgi:queuine tRNA-ribosyltransferase subunit QTRTD1